jgi:prepilin-type N-terminal cleavage/methylation domain-containing protein
MQHKRGFTLIEILTVMAIIGLIGSIVAIATGGVRARGRDTKRIADLSQMGRFVSLSCYLPDAGPGDYDLSTMLNEFKAKNPQAAAVVSRVPHDPRSGTEDDTGYRYVVGLEGKKCAFYANLENKNAEVTLDSISLPTAGGGTGVFQASSDGRNGTPFYYQVSN